MSEQKFNDAKSSLALSQHLRGQLMPVAQGQPQEAPQAQQDPQMSQESSQPQTAPTEPNTGVQEAVKSAMEPYMKEIKDLLSKETKDVELKIEGTMAPATEPETKM